LQRRKELEPSLALLEREQANGNEPTSQVLVLGLLALLQREA
jgi:hypothetical protein